MEFRHFDKWFKIFEALKVQFFLNHAISRFLKKIHIKIRQKPKREKIQCSEKSVVLCVNSNDNGSIAGQKKDMYKKTGFF